MFSDPDSILSHPAYPAAVLVARLLLCVAGAGESSSVPGPFARRSAPAEGLGNVRTAPSRPLQVPGALPAQRGASQARHTALQRHSTRSTRPPS